MEISWEQVMMLLVVVIVIAIFVSIIYLLFVGGTEELGKNTTVLELAKIWS